MPPRPLSDSTVSSKDTVLKEGTDAAGQDVEASQSKKAEWKPRKQEFLVMITLAIISLVIALDATILVPVLPVCDALSDHRENADPFKDPRCISERDRGRRILGGHLLPPYMRSLPTLHRGALRHFRQARTSPTFRNPVHCWFHCLRFLK